MSLAADLVDQADHLTSLERGRPKQASLRRAISSAYYSLFHLIVDDASRYLVAGSRLRAAVARSFEHQTLRAAAAALGDVSRKPTGAHWFRSHLHDPISPDLTFVCDVFIDLQGRRHSADYDTDATFTRLQAEGVVNIARRVHSVWSQQRNTHNAHALILASAKLLRPR